jgi:hypothetical protein
MVGGAISSAMGGNFWQGFTSAAVAAGVSLAANAVAEEMERSETTGHGQTSGDAENRSTSGAPAISKSKESRQTQPDEADRLKMQQLAQKNEVETEVCTVSYANGTTVTFYYEGNYADFSPNAWQMINTLRLQGADLKTYSHAHGLGGQTVHGPHTLRLHKALPGEGISWKSLQNGGYIANIQPGASLTFGNGPTWRADYEIYDKIHYLFPNAKLYITAPGVEWRYVPGSGYSGAFEQLSK